MASLRGRRASRGPVQPSQIGVGRHGERGGVPSRVSATRTRPNEERRAPVSRTMRITATAPASSATGWCGQRGMRRRSGTDASSRSGRRLTLKDETSLTPRSTWRVRRAANASRHSPLRARCACVCARYRAALGFRASYDSSSAASRVDDARMTSTLVGDAAELPSSMIIHPSAPDAPAERVNGVMPRPW